ncbi:hypothetical protein F2P81_004141 [Scophthalmus maximus]|uniref:Uncharacterized protein n=1 Tax=Scophthalmus maximus TaxID=52904 RepID=A0A6A4THU8_SCOMX|nr:hypothetical protein F2P81_004141 [Scophthalmus maximus]
MLLLRWDRRRPCGPKDPGAVNSTRWLPGRLRVGVGTRGDVLSGGSTGTTPAAHVGQKRDWTSLKLKSKLVECHDA